MSSEDEPGVTIILEKQVSLTFSLKYLSNFAKSAPLAREVSLNMSNDVPLLVQFDFEQGTLQFFLAPKVCLARANLWVCVLTSRSRMSKRKGFDEIMYMSFPSCFIWSHGLHES